MQEERNKGSYIGQAWLVIVLALLYGGGLAGVQTALSGRIEQNKKAETYQVIPDLVAGAEASRTEELTIRGENGKDTRAYKVASSDGDHIGWVLPAGGSGFADRIELLIGLDTEISTITGLYVLDQKETPGLGDNITTDAFQERFRNAPTDRPLVVVKTDPSQNNEIRALSGATISSESVAAIVNGALANCRAPLQELAAQARPTRQGLVEPSQ